MSPSILRPPLVYLVTALAVVLLASCGSGDTITTTAPLASGELCEPGPSADAGVDETEAPGRNGEALVLHLTGFDELAITEETEGDPVTYDAPNYGGVYGDRAGGWVVAVVDCSKVDPDRIAQLAGGPEKVRLIEVPHSFEEVTEFRDRLAQELDGVGVRGDLAIDSTLTGRHIRVMVADIDELDDGFGSAVPSYAFTVEEGPLFSEG